MCAFRVTVSRRRRQELEHQLHTAQQLGQLQAVKCLLAIVALTDGHSCEAVARTLRVTPTTVHPWVRRWRSLACKACGETAPAASHTDQNAAAPTGPAD